MSRRVMSASGHAQLARAIAEADSALHVELRQIGAEYGVLIGSAPIPAE